MKKCAGMLKKEREEERRRKSRLRRWLRWLRGLLWSIGSGAFYALLGGPL